MPKASELKTGMIVAVRDKPYIVRKVQPNSPTARGAGTIYKVRFNHAQSGQKLDESLRADDFFPAVDYQRRDVQFLYREGDAYTFMDNEDYAQHTLDAEQIEDSIPFLKDGLGGITALIIEGVCVSVEVPDIVDLEIIETSPAIKGASASARTKVAVLSTGLEVQVPEYLAQGEVIRVNTAGRNFVSRA